MAALQINERLLDEKLTQLEAARNWSPRVISKLETLIRTADDYDLFRLNPLQYAADKNMIENETIDLFLYGTKFGLFEMEWHLLCPSCGHVVESFAELTHLHTHYVCASCSAEYNATLDDFIEVSFTISPQIRDSMFRYPDTLSIEDYYLKYHLSKTIDPSPDADTYIHPLSVMNYIEPHTSKCFELDLIPGVFIIRSKSRVTGVAFLVTENPAAASQTLPLQVVDGKLYTVDRVLSAHQLYSGGFNRVVDQIGILDKGKVLVEVENETDTRHPVWLSNFVVREPTVVEFVPFLTGKKLLTMQTFRDLFRSEVVQTNEGIGVKDITFLFTDLKGSTEMYDTIGDAKAYYLVRQHFDTLSKVIVDNSGAIVKTIGDAVMATFMTPIDAVKAAVDMLRDIEEFNRSISQQLILKIGIHRGHSIVVTLNDRLDYFGQTVNIAARVQGLAGAGEIYVTDSTFDETTMAAVLAGCVVTPEQVSLKGVSGTLQVHKIVAQ